MSAAAREPPGRRAPGAAPAATLLVVAPPPRLRSASRSLAGAFELLTAEDAPAAESLLLAHRADVALVDVDAAGDALAVALRHHVPVVASGRDANALVRALDAGASAVAPPGDDPALLVALLRRTVGSRRTAHAEEPDDQADDTHLVAVSGAMRVVARKLRAAARTWSPVLVVGEPGVGRSYVARTLHEETGDARPLVELLAAELGHAVELERLRGLLATGDAATVVVDGLEAARPEALTALSRELEGRARRPARVRVVGIGTPEARDVARRLLPAFPIVLDVPPLSQRLDDLPLLAHLLLRRAAGRLGRGDVRRLGVEAVRALRRQPWPGGARELELTLEQAVLVCAGPTVVPSDLPFHSAERERRRDRAERLAALASEELFDLPHPEAKLRAMAAFDVAYAEAMLARSGGNISVAARAAGMDRSNFKRLIRRTRSAADAGAPAPSEPATK